MTYPNGEVVNTSYNDAMEPRTLTGSSSYVDNATYNALGLPKMLDLGNNLFQHFTYWGNGLDFTFSGFNTWGRLRAICVSAHWTCADAENNGNVRMHLAYAYDNVGNITTQADWTTGNHPTFSYDAQDRLVSWGFLNGATQETYSYDALGRMTNRSWLGGFNYGDANRPYQVTAIPGGGIANYDANGNMRDRWSNNVWFHHEWNAENKASRVHGGGQDIRYFYDADGELVRRTSGGETVVYVGPHAEWSNIHGWTHYYHFSGQRVAKRNGSNVFWLHGDHLGSTSLATNSAGGTHSQMRYTPWGQQRWASGSIPSSYRYTDQRQEGGVELYDYDARLYSPVTLRFISPDPIVPALDNVQDWNRYAYVRHNPMIYTDPTGHVPILIPLAAMFVVKVALKAAPVIVAGSAIAHRAAPAVQRINSSPIAQQAIAKTNQAASSVQVLATRNPQATEAMVEGVATASMTFARTNDPSEALIDGFTASVSGRVDAKIKQMGIENGAHKFVVGAHRTVAQAIGNGVGEITKQLMSTEPGDVVRNWSGQSIAQTFTQFIPGDGLSDTVVRTAVTAYGASQISQAIERQTCQSRQAC